MQRDSSLNQIALLGAFAGTITGWSKNDSADLPEIANGLYALADGTIRLEIMRDAEGVFYDVPVSTGDTLPFYIRKIHNTTTTLTEAQMILGK